MSWSFEHNGKNKEALKKAALASIEHSASHHGEAAKRLVEPVLKMVSDAIDVARVTASANHLKVKSSGHIDAQQCYFSIEIIPVYLPTMVD